MNLLKEIIERKSISAFSDKEIEKEKIDAVLEAGRLAPSCFNNQPWRYVLVGKSDYNRKNLEKALSPSNSWAKKANYLVVVGGNPKDDSSINDVEYYLYDIGLSVMSFCLEAEHQGLRTHQMAGWDKDKVSKAVSFSKDIKPVIVIALGVEDKNPNILSKITAKIKEKLIRQRKRKDMSKIAFYGVYKK
ncbi:MAG: nitroreductase family protein [Candidatus Pacearchaeota archaeon]|nr:nitroreductase family protein [Candidatus Pacearchaeota archaeon]